MYLYILKEKYMTMFTKCFKFKYEYSTRLLSLYKYHYAMIIHIK